MRISNKVLVLFLFSCRFFPLAAVVPSIRIEDSRDYEVLSYFFKMNFLEEDYGYVLEGSKPISIVNFYSLDNFPIARDLEYTEKQFMKTLLVREAIPVWNRLCSFQENFVLKATPLNAPGEPELGWEVSFINIPKLKETIEKNIDLFRYVLGPLTRSTQILERLAYSKEPFSDVLCNNCVLIGIVLGFGSNNSLIGGRSEMIDALSRSRDIAPFAAKSNAMRNMKEYYGWYFFDIAGGETYSDYFKKNCSPLKPSIGFLDIKEELLAIETAKESLPACLKEKPMFIFDAYTGESSNKLLFAELKKNQKKIQKLLQKSDFLEQVLKKISKKKPVITCKKPILFDLAPSFFQEKLDFTTWDFIFSKAIEDFASSKDKLMFLNSLSNPITVPSETSFMPRVLESTLRGLRKACENLSNSNVYFNEIAKDSAIQSIVEKQLYFRTTQKGSGKELKKETFIRAHYIVTNAKGDLFFAHHDHWLNLSDTIPGFAHGVQGMCIGETRELFIHPCLAYGELTTLPPCTELIIKVQLLEIEEASLGKIPSLEPLDFRWIQNKKLHSFIEKSIELKPVFIASFYSGLLDKIDGSRKTIIIERLQKKALEFLCNDQTMTESVH